jgi:AcrR family transcriptional regulator
MSGSRERALQMQRARILDAMVVVVCHRSFAGASVSSLCAQARVSRRVFYELFDDLQECFLALLDEGASRASVLVSRAFDREESWLDGVRGALAALLGFFESEPDLAYVLLVEAPAPGSWARERREQHVASLTSLIEGRWGEPNEIQPHPLATAGVMASLLGVLHTHLVAGRREPLVALLGPLMGLVTAPYLDQASVTREVERGEAVGRELLARCRREQSRHPAGRAALPNVLLDPRSHRSRACLLYVTAHPGVNNRQVARGIGISRDSHISTLLARLRRAGLLVKHPAPAGGANAWLPSDFGLRVAERLQLTQRDEAHSGASEARHV